MTSYTRLGLFLLADEVAALPYGRIHRCLTLSGKALDQHHLLFTFTDELLDAGLGSRWPDAQRIVAQLAGSRCFGTGYQLLADRPVRMACDYAPGRTLAQMLAKAREEQLPLGVDQALMTFQGLAQALVQMHGKGLQHGVLTDHSAWVTFEGAARILDAPVAAAIHASLAKTPALKSALAPFRPEGPATPFQQDLFGLGAMLYGMLTLEPLPPEPALAEALDRATLRAAQEEAPIPEEILAFLKRLLLVGVPFGSAAEFNASLERVLFEGDYSPTTFSLAFLMHTLFREEIDTETAAVKHEQAADFSAHLPAEASAPAPAAPRAGGGSRALPWLAAGGGLAVAAVIGLLFYQMQSSNRQHALEQRSLQARLEAFQRDKEAADAKLAELAKQEEAQKSLEEMFGKQAEAATSQEAKAAAKRDLEAARQKRSEIARQQAEIKQKQAQPEPQDLDAPPQVARLGSAQAPAGGAKALPAELRQQDLKVALRVLVDAAGKPQKLMLVRGVEGNYGYNDSAQNAAMASTYVPGRKNGKPAAGWVDVTIHFGKPQ
jgi:hypothetical protein